MEALEEDTEASLPPHRALYTQLADLALSGWTHAVPDADAASQGRDAAPERDLFRSRQALYGGTGPLARREQSLWMARRRFEPRRSVRCSTHTHTRWGEGLTVAVTRCRFWTVLAADSALDGAVRVPSRHAQSRPLPACTDRGSSRLFAVRDGRETRRGWIERRVGRRVETQVTCRGTGARSRSLLGSLAQRLTFRIGAVV